MTRRIATAKTVGRQRARAGFTLIELLIVIAIIAVLAAILFPVFSRARENARRSSCQSNLKQIGLGLMQYIQDYDERFPQAWPGNTFGTATPQTNAAMPGAKLKTNCGTTDGYWVSWMDVVQPYVKSVQIFVCPSAARPEESSYGYSTCISGYKRSSYTGGGSGRVPVALRQVRRPSEIVLILDRNTVDSLIGTEPFSIGSEARTSPDGDKIFPHFDGGNIGYVDGHVKWQKRDKAKAYAPDGTALDDRAWNAFLN